MRCSGDGWNSGLRNADLTGIGIKAVGEAIGMDEIAQGVCRLRRK